MTSKTTKVEMETIILWDAEATEATIYSAYPAQIRKLHSLAEKFPDAYKLVREDGYGATFSCPVKMIAFNAPRIKRELSDDEKQAAADRLEKAREKRARK